MSAVLIKQRTYSISECADTLGVSVGWLRIGERLGALPLARRNHSGWRYYTPEDIQRLRRLGVGDRKRRLKEHREQS